MTRTTTRSCFLALAAVAIAIALPATASAQTITGLRPDIGAPGDVFGIIGSGFTNSHVVQMVGTSTATVNVQVLRASPQALLCRVPADAATGPVTVNGVAGPTFTVVSAQTPIIYRMAPTTAPDGAGVHLIGRRFRTPGNPSTIQLEPTAGGAPVPVTQALIGRFMARFQIPPGTTAGTYHVVLNNGVATTGANSPILTVVAAGGTPVINSTNPTQGPPFRRVRLIGEYLGFGPGRVRWTGVGGTPVRETLGFANGFNEVHTSVPVAPAGPYSVDWRTRNGTVIATYSGTFTITSAPAPVITDIRPNPAHVGQGFIVTGHNFFGSGVYPEMTLDHALLNSFFTFHNGVELGFARVPPTATPGTTYQVRVVNGAGTSAPEPLTVN